MTIFSPFWSPHTHTIQTFHLICLRLHQNENKNKKKRERERKNRIFLAVHFVASPANQKKKTFGNFHKRAKASSKMKVFLVSIGPCFCCASRKSASAALPTLRFGTFYKLSLLFLQSQATAVGDKVHHGCSVCSQINPVSPWAQRDQQFWEKCC